MNPTLSGLLQASVNPPQPLLQAARHLDPGDLFPVQRTALEGTRLLHGESLLVLSPTGTGKSLIADATILAALARGLPVLALVSTRALARERAAVLSQALGPAGYRVALSTRDDRSCDDDILAGRVDLTISVYEKARSLFARSAGLRRHIGLLVLDECQLLSDSERGPGARALIHAWREEHCSLQILALAATLPAPAAEARFLGCRLLQSDERVVPLRCGHADLARGLATWKCDLTGEHGRFALPRPVEADTGPFDRLSEILEAFEKPLLVFAATRHEAGAVAFHAAEHRPVDPSTEWLEGEEDLDPQLLHMLRHRVGLHTSDLSRRQRQLVESMLQSGRLDLCAATTTLAEGVNLRARTVLVLPGAERLAGANLSNLLGRAGRPGSGTGYAFVLRGIADHDGSRVYTIPSIASPSPEVLLEAAAWLLSAREHATTRQVAHFLDQLGLSETNVHALLRRGERIGLWTIDGEQVELAAPGRILAGGGMTPDAVSGWRTLLRRFPEGGGEASMAFLALGGARVCERLVPLTHDERLTACHLRQLCSELDREDTPLARYLADFLSDSVSAPRRHHLAAKGTLMLLHIRRGGTFNDLVNDAWITAGRLEEFLASARHTLGAVGQLMQLLGMKPPTCLGRLDPPERDDAVPQTMSDSGFDDMEKTGSLVIRMDSTGVVIWNGREVTLTRIQFRLLELLARHAGEGIPYERIERYVWPDACVERQQVSFHRKNLETRLAVTGQSPRIETLASWGLRLALDRSLVRFEESKTTAPVFRHAPASIINVNSVAREVCL